MEKRSRSSPMPLLLLKDVKNLGRKGEIVRAKPGFVRNFLIPQKKATFATPRTVKLQRQLQEERQQQALVDREESEKWAQRLKEKRLTIVVKSDPQGHLYGSVTATDVLQLIEKEEGVSLEKKQVLLPRSIKRVGDYPISLSLKEGVQALFTLEVQSEQGIQVSPSLSAPSHEEKGGQEAKEEGSNSSS